MAESAEDSQVDGRERRANNCHRIIARTRLERPTRRQAGGEGVGVSRGRVRRSSAGQHSGDDRRSSMAARHAARGGNKRPPDTRSFSAAPLVKKRASPIDPTVLTAINSTCAIVFVPLTARARTVRIQKSLSWIETNE